jgi:lactate dehydrogenase-like 2-hydroxyacid dehydrogenase
MASAQLHPVLNSVSPSVRIDSTSSSNYPTIVAPHSQMSMMTRAVVKPAVLHIGAVVPMLQEALEKKYDFYALGEQEDLDAFLAQKGSSIRGVVTCTQAEGDFVFVDRELVSKLPNLEIVSAFHDSDVKKLVDVHLCKKLGVHVTDTRDTLANKCAAIATHLLMAISREVVDAGRYVRARRWPTQGNYPVPFRVRSTI